MIIGPTWKMRAMLDDWKNDTEWARWLDDQVPFNRALAKNETTVDYYGNIVWTGGADLDSFKAVAFNEMIDGITSMIPYGQLLPKLGMSVITGQVPVLLHANMGCSAKSCDALTKDKAFDMILKDLWWSSGRTNEFQKIALQQLHLGRMYIGANDTVGKGYDELCGPYRESTFRVMCKAVFRWLI